MKCNTFVVPVALIVNTQELGLFPPYKGSSYLKIEVLSQSLRLTLPQLPSARIQDPVDPGDFIATFSQHPVVCTFASV